MAKILLVDDDVDLAELVKTKLDAEGHQTFVINTGDGAFEYAKKVGAKRVDFIIAYVMARTIPRSGNTSVRIRCAQDWWSGQRIGRISGACMRFLRRREGNHEMIAPRDESV